MSRRPSVIRPTLLHLALPEDVRAKLDLHLFSPLEGRVPKGAYQAFFLERIANFFDSRRLDLSLYGLPPGYYVRGPREMVERLEALLRSKGA